MADSTAAAAAVTRSTWASSPDGVTWTRNTTPVTQTLRAVAFGSGRYVAVGDNGVRGVASIDRDAVRFTRRECSGLEWLARRLANRGSRATRRN